MRKRESTMLHSRANCSRLAPGLLRPSPTAVGEDYTECAQYTAMTIGHFAQLETEVRFQLKEKRFKDYSSRYS